MAPDGPLPVCVACSCRTLRTLIPEARGQMIEPPAIMPREGGSDTRRWWFCLVMAHLRPDDPWWLPPPSLVAPNGNIAGPKWQYRVAPEPPNTHARPGFLAATRPDHEWQGNSAIPGPATRPCFGAYRHI